MNVNLVFQRLLLLFMKVTLIQFCLLTIFTGLVCAHDTNAQEILEQRITLKMDNAEIRSILSKIEGIAKVKFMYSPETIQSRRKVKIDVANERLDQVLSQFFAPLKLTYEVNKRTIILNLDQSKIQSILLPMQDSPNDQFAKIDISGRVTDEKGDGLPGVNIAIKGTTTGSSTDVNGKYVISVPNDNAVLVFSFVGFITREVQVTGRSQIDMKLFADTKALNEVVVVGYGTQKKVNLTGAVDVVTSEALANRPAPNVSTLLQGTSPGLNISMTSQGGKPGSSNHINIRGLGSINGNDSPLILVDGVESSIDNLDPETIESVSVLKDASASAVYGSRAPFGVILIVTKRGKKNQPFRMQYNNILSFATPIAVPHFADAVTWATAYNDASANAGLAPVYPAEQVQRMKDYIAGTYKTEYDLNNPPDIIWNGRWMGNANNDWPGMYWKKNAFSQKHNINMEGGGEKTQYFISAGFFDQGGLSNWGNDGFKRSNILANVTSQVNDWLRFDFRTNYTRSEQNQPLGPFGLPESLINAFLSFGPMTPMYNIDGSVSNPLVRALQASGRNIDRNNALGITLATELEPIKGWKTNVSYNFKYGGSVHTENPIPVPVNVPNGTIGNIGASSSGYVENLATSDYTLINARTSYERTTGAHYFMAMVGYEQELSFYRGLYGSKMDLITETVPSISTALGTSNVYDAINHWSTQGVFGRLNYNFKEKYLVEFSGRYNGSSRFAKDSRWGFFPSMSAGYNISNENFWATVEPYVNSLKVRGSYGALGNQNIANYAYLSTIPVNTQLPYIINNVRPIYATAPGIVSSNLTWETITTLDFGLDAGFLKNRLTLSSDWYNRITSNMFGPSETLPAVLGTGTPFSNNAKLSTKGWELSLGWNDRISADFSYHVKINIGDNKSKILKYKNDNGFIDNWYEGKNFGEIWGFTSDKIIQTVGEKMPDQSRYYSTWGPGDMKYSDKDGNDIINDGTRTLKDHGDVSVIGNTTPRYNYGIKAGLNWKGLDVSMFWQGIGKRDYLPSEMSEIFFGIIPNGFPGSESAMWRNGPSLNYWRPANETNMLGPNTDAYFTKPYFSDENRKNRLPQSRYVLNAAYIRLKNFQIGYTVPQKLSMKVHFYKAKVYFSGENLLTFIKLPKTMDPETVVASDPGPYQAGAIYPIARNLSFGINLTF